MIYLSSLSETASRASRYRTAWRTPHSIAASRRTSWPPGRRCVQSAHPRGAAPEHRNKCATRRHICFDVLERLLAGEPIGRIVRSEEHTSELQSHSDLVCRPLLENNKYRRPS